MRSLELVGKQLEGQSYDSLSLSTRSEFQDLLSCAASVFVSHSLNVAPSLGLGIANRVAWCIKHAVTIVHSMKARYVAETAENSSRCALLLGGATSVIVCCGASTSDTFSVARK